MKILAQLLLGITFLTLTACSKQHVKQSQTEPEQTIPSDSQKSLDSELSTGSIDVPPMTSIKAGKDLHLVRTMEGGACKNDQQGVLGMFLLYANNDDVERIKRNQGAKIFSEFEKTIETFSLVALQKAVQETDFASDPLIDAKKAQQKIFRQLAKQFRIAVEGPVNSFQEKTTLIIDVAPFPSSFVLYNNDCEVTFTPTDHK